MPVLKDELIREADRYIDEHHEAFAALGGQFFDQFGSDRGKISTQVRNLQQLACTATRFADIEDFVKNQMGKGKDDGNAKRWRALGEEVLGQLSKLRRDSEKLDDSPASRMAFRLHLARGWVRAVVGEYLYRLALKQMEGKS